MGSGNDDIDFKTTKDDVGGTEKISSDPDTSHSWHIDEGSKVAFQPTQDYRTRPGKKIRISPSYLILESGNGTSLFGLCAT
jgi:hypothetical protein